MRLPAEYRNNPPEYYLIQKDDFEGASIYHQNPAFRYNAIQETRQERVFFY